MSDENPAMRKGRQHNPAQAAQNQDTAEQVDAHAAFRQGATALAGYVRSVLDVQADRDRRDEVLREAIDNLEFVRRTFNRDPEHRVYYLEALRLQSIAYALVGRESAALVMLEELEDALAGSSVPREQQIELEAIYNQAILHWKRATDAKQLPSSDSIMASLLWDRIAGRGDEVRHAQSVWQLAQLASVNRRDWPALDRTKAQAVLDKSRKLASDLEKRAAQASGAERRHCVLLAQNIHRYYAIAQLRLIATFELPGRGPFAPNAAPMSRQTVALVESSLGCFALSDAIGPATFNALVTRAYGALLLSNFRDAEQLAKLALANDAADQYARYLAVEAVLQRRGEEAGRQCLAELQIAPLEDAALIELAAHLAPQPDSGPN
jgi:hypothetical protein